VVYEGVDAGVCDTALTKTRSFTGQRFPRIAHLTTLPEVYEKRKSQKSFKRKLFSTKTSRLPRSDY
jgi:hypothetical protein